MTRNGKSNVPIGAPRPIDTVSLPGAMLATQPAPPQPAVPLAAGDAAVHLANSAPVLQGEGTGPTRRTAR